MSVVEISAGDRVLFARARRMIDERDARMDASPPPRPPVRRAACVYFVQSAGSGSIKIGRTTNLGQRLLTLQAASGERLSLLAVIETEDHLSVEAGLHRRFANLRLHGEWFRPDVCLLAFIEQLG